MDNLVVTTVQYNIKNLPYIELKRLKHLFDAQLSKDLVGKTIAERENWTVSASLVMKQERIAILKQLSVSDVWGTGRRISKKLELMNIHSAFQLASMPPILTRKQFSIEIERTVRELNGQACKVLDEERADKKQIFSTRSVGEHITDYESLLQALGKHVCIAAANSTQTSLKLQNHAGFCQ